MKKRSKFLSIFIIILILGLGIFVYFRFYYVFGVGVKTGELNYVVKKGYIFKTYEGKIIQSGFQTEGNSPGVHSNEFVFSVDDEEVAQQLMHTYEGKEVSLQYKEYVGALPWRGYSKYVVSKIIAVKDTNPHGKPVIPPVYQ